MRRFKHFLTAGLIAASFAPLEAEEKYFHITGFVGTVGSNLGTEIDGSSPDFMERDAFDIKLYFETNQTPSVVPAVGGETATYKLLQSTITIFGDNATFSWTTTQNSSSHSFGITNNYGGTTDTFSSGGSLLGFSGSLLGPSSKAFSHWNLQFVDWDNTLWSDTSIPTFLDLSKLNNRAIELTFAGFMTADTITLSTTSFAVVSAIPEPSTYAAIAGACALGFVAYRRRQRAAR